MNVIEHVWIAGLAGVSVVWPAVSVPLPTPAPANHPVAVSRPAPLPIKQEGQIAPVVAAKAALLVDVPSGTVLYAKDADKPLPIASLTKLMTAHLAVQRTKPTDIITVPETNVTEVESRSGLTKGQQFTADDLLAATMIASANDAAMTLAVQTAGSFDAFVTEMNRETKRLGMTDSHFANPTGYDSGDSYASARDLAILARAVMQEPRIRAVVASKERVIKAVDGTEFKLQTTDELLGGYLPIAGLKTGTTDAAGECLVSVLQSGDREVLAIVLNSPSRFQENKSMLDWSLRSYHW